jgi:hypothetical protein
MVALVVIVVEHKAVAVVLVVQQVEPWQMHQYLLKLQETLEAVETQAEMLAERVVLHQVVEVVAQQAINQLVAMVEYQVLAVVVVVTVTIKVKTQTKQQVAAAAAAHMPEYTIVVMVPLLLALL